MTNESDIIEISKNTRKRLINNEWKLEYKHPETGVWCIHPAQWFADNQDSMEKMYEEMDEEMKQEEEYLRNPVYAQKLVDGVKDEDERIIVKTVIATKYGFTFTTSATEIIFDAEDGKRYIAQHSYWSGTYLQPLEEDGFVSELDGFVKGEQDYIDRFMTIDENKIKERGLDTPEKIENEKKRLRNIIRDHFETVKRLTPFLKVS